MRNCGTVPPLLGQVKGKRGLVLGAVACLGCLLGVFAPPADAGPRPRVGSLQADDAALAAKSRSAVLDLYSLDARLAAAAKTSLRAPGAGRRLVAERARSAASSGSPGVDTASPSSASPHGSASSTTTGPRARSTC